MFTLTRLSAEFQMLIDVNNFQSSGGDELYAIFFDTLKEIFKKVFGLEVDKIMKGRKTKLHVLVLY